MIGEVPSLDDWAMVLYVLAFGFGFGGIAGLWRYRGFRDMRPWFVRMRKIGAVLAILATLLLLAALAINGRIEIGDADRSRGKPTDAYKEPTALATGTQVGRLHEPGPAVLRRHEDDRREVSRVALPVARQ